MRARSLPHLRRCPAFSQRTRTALVTLSHLFTWTGHDYLSLSQLQGIMSYACGRVHYSIVREDDTAAARQRARKTELLRTRARAPTQWPRSGARIPMRVYEQAVRVPPFPPLPPARILGIVDREEASAWRKQWMTVSLTVSQRRWMTREIFHYLPSRVECVYSLLIRGSRVIGAEADIHTYVRTYVETLDFFFLL